MTGYNKYTSTSISQISFYQKQLMIPAVFHFTAVLEKTHLYYIGINNHKHNLDLVILFGFHGDLD